MSAGPSASKHETVPGGLSASYKWWLVVMLWLVCFLCANFVAVIFPAWTPTFLVEKFHYGVGAAGLTGTVSTCSSGSPANAAANQPQ
jgi:hypothetical protein